MDEREVTSHRKEEEERRREVGDGTSRNYIFFGMEIIVRIWIRFGD